MIVVSGGQTGADLAGLWAAKLAGIKTGGYIPKGYRTLVGSKPQLAHLFNLQETEASNYQFRTKANACTSDLTLILASNFQSSGTKLTIDICKKNNVKFIMIPFNESDNLDNWNPKEAQEVKKLILVKASIFDNFTLNVAGNSSKSSVRAYDFAFKFCCMLFDVEYKNYLENTRDRYEFL